MLAYLSRDYIYVITGNSLNTRKTRIKRHNNALKVNIQADKHLFTIILIIDAAEARVDIVSAIRETR